MLEKLTPYTDGKSLYTPEDRALAFTEFNKEAEGFNDFVASQRATRAHQHTLTWPDVPIDVALLMVGSQLDADVDVLTRKDQLHELRRQWEIIDLRTPRPTEWTFRGERA